MRVFSRWLNESKLSYDKNDVSDILRILEPFVYTKRNYHEELIENIYYGMKDAVKNYFEPYDEPYEILVSKMYSIEDNSLRKRVAELVSSYGEMKKGYYRLESMVQSILNSVKIGDSKYLAAKKLLNMTKKVMYYSITMLGYEGNFFKPTTEEEIEKQIKRNQGTIRLKGVVDLYVDFKNDKVVKVYFKL